MKTPTRKKPLRRTERFESVEEQCRYPDREGVVARIHGWWKTIKFHQLKKGDIFRLFDTKDNGREVPDQVLRGHHVVNVALEDAKKMPMPMMGVVKCLPLVRGFQSRRK